MFEVFDQMTHQYNRTSYEQLKEFIYRYQEELLDRGDALRDSVRTPEELASFRLEMREKFLEKIGGLPPMDTPLDPVVTGMLDGGDFTVEAVRFTTRPGVYATGSFYKPKNVKTPGPAVLFVCGHAGDGRMDDNYQMVCQTLVKAGLMVFALDPTGQGERSNFYDPETGRFLINRTTQDHDAVGVPMLATGQFLARSFLCDELRAIDYLQSRPEVDPEQIGLTGNSGGGTQTMATITVDDRIKIAAPGTFVTNRREYMYTGQAQDSEQIWPDCTEYGFDHVTPLLIFAPKPLMILAVDCDFFPSEGTLATFEEGKRFYGLLGAEENLKLVMDHNTHMYTETLARAAASFFSEYFFGHPAEVDNSHLSFFTVEQMNATKTGQIKGEFPEARFIQDETEEEAARLREARLSLPKEERLARARAFLLEKAYKNREQVPFRPRIFPKSACVQTGGYMGTSCSWFTQKRLFSYGVMVKKYAEEDIESLPVTFCVWTDGTKKIGAHEDFIRAEIEKGRQVFVLDVPGVGAIEQRNMVLMPQELYKKSYGTLFTLACDLLYSGDSLAAMHLYDTLRALDMLKESFGVSDRDIEIYSEGADGVCGVMAAFLRPDCGARYGEGLLKVEGDVIGRYPFIYDNTLAQVIPGMLRYFDFDELIR